MEVLSTYLLNNRHLNAIATIIENYYIQEQNKNKNSIYRQHINDRE